MGKGGGGGSAPSPDPRIGEAAIRNAQLGRDWLNFARVRTGQSETRQRELDRLTKRIGEQQIQSQNRANQWSQQDRNRWENVFRPLENRMVREAENWDSRGRQQRMAGQARADVLSSSRRASAARSRDMASMGIDPRSGRYAGIERGADQQTALAAAGAQNQARNQVRNQGVALRADAVNLGRGLPSQAAQGANLGLQAGNSALGGAQATNAQSGQAASIMGQGFQGAMQGNSSMMQGLNQQYGNQLQAWSTNRQAAAQQSAGLWGGLGSAAGTAAGFMMMSSKEVKTDKRPVDGSALEAIKGLPVERWRYREGVQDGGEREHIGPYAEDMRDKAGVGDGQQIPLQDMMGLQLKAIQELGIKVDQIESGRGAGRSPKAIGSRRPDDIETEYMEKTA